MTYRMMYKPSIRILKIGLFKLCLLLTLGSFSQGFNLGKPQVINYGHELYHGGTHNWEIDTFQSRKLFANNDGLLSFDGYRWQLHSLPNKTIVRSVTAEGTSRIYIGGQDEIGYFSPDQSGNLKFSSIRDKIPEAYRSLEDVWDIEIADSIVYARSVNRIYLFKPDTVVVFDPEQAINFMKKCGSRVYFNGFENGLYVYEKGELSFVENSEIFKYKTIVSVVESDSGLLVFTSDDGIYSYINNEFVPWNIQLSLFFSDKEIISSEASYRGSIAVGTALNGIFIFNQDGNAIQHLEKKSGLQNNNILSIFTDSDGSIWTGSSNGIDYISNSNRRYIFPDGEQEGAIYDIAVHKGEIYFATNNGLYSSEWKPFYDPLRFAGFNNIDESSGQVWALDTIGNSLFMGHNEGAFIIENGRAEKISEDPGYWKFIGVDDNSKVIAGGYNGLSLFEKRGGRWTFVKKIEGFSESSRIVVKENEKRFWVAHPYRGIFQINFTDDYEEIKVKKYTTDNGLPSLLRNHVFLIDGQAVFAGESNIYRYNEQKDSFYIDKEFEELLGSENTVLRLFQDPQERIWYLTENDFGFLDADQNTLSRNFAKTSLSELSEQFVDGFEELYFVENGDIMIPSKSGVIQILRPDEPRTQKPNALISRVIIQNNNDSIIYGGYQSLDDKFEGNNSGDIELHYSHNALRFEFFNDPIDMEGPVRFKASILGIDDNKSQWTYEAYKDYSRLPHGKYTFTLEAKNKYGNSGEISRLEFEIQPPWYESRLLQFVYGLLILLFLAGLVYFPRIRLREKVKVLEDVQEKSKDEIIQLRTDKLQAEIDFKNQQLASSMMHIVQKNEVLNKIKEEAELLKKYIKEPQAEKEIRKLISLLSDDERLDDDWENFAYYFDQVHTDFLRRLKQKYPKLSPKDQKLCAYLRMNLTTKEIAPLLNISVRGVEISRYRLRKKLDLHSTVNLNDFMMSY